MSKEQKRERRKIDRSRRARAHTKAAGALAAGAAIAAGTQAYAAPVRYDNPAHGEADHFHWPTYYFAGQDPKWLDITQAADAQPNVQSSSSFMQYWYYDTSQGFFPHLMGGNNGAADIEQKQVPGLVPGNYLLTSHPAGTLIPSGAPWTSFPFYPTAMVSRPEYLQGFLPIGVPTYVGVRFDLGDGDRYGWIGVVREGGTDKLEPFAWGYETEVGVPIVAGAPEPGSLALLAFGVAGVAIRRRQSA